MVVERSAPIARGGATKSWVARGGELPRERLLRSGAGSLSDAELISILLGTGNRDIGVEELGERVLESVGGLHGLRTADPRSVSRKGIGPAKACRVLAAVEIATRLAFAEQPKRLCFDRPEACARYLLLRYARRDQEVMGAVYVNVRNEALHECELYRGTLRRAAVEPRGILREALTVGAAGVLLFHTHPSGDPSPSLEDLAFTERLEKAGRVVGVQLLDHLILGGPDRWTSLRRTGALRAAN